MKKRFKFSRLLAVSALLIAGSAAYYSIFGLSQLFAGASLAVIVMASCLEFGKIVTVSFLQRYWTKVSSSLRNYLAIVVIILVLITSAGIYGFLSNAYQKTASKLEVFEGKVAVLEGKKTLFLKGVSDNQKIIDSKSKRIDQLTNLRLTQEDRLDVATSSRAKDKVRNDIVNATKEIQKLTQDIDTLNAKNSVLSDSANAYNTKALESKTDNTIAGEVGPLKYLAQLTGQPMDKIVNYFILLLIFVFDPLAVALVIATNKVMQLENEPEETPTAPPANGEPVKESSDNIPTNIITNNTLEPEENTFTSNDEFPDFIMNEDIEEEKNDEPVIEEPVIEEPVIEEPSQVLEPTIDSAPVIPTGRIRVEDIRGKKENGRGFSVNVPPPRRRNNSIEEINDY